MENRKTQHLGLITKGSLQTQGWGEALLLVKTVHLVSLDSIQIALTGNDQLKQQSYIFYL